MNVAAISGSWVMTTSVVPLALQPAQQLHDLGAGAAVEVAGRLVGEHQRRLADDGPRDRHPLPLAAGQLVRPVAEPVPEPDPLQRATARRSRRARSGVPR